MNDGADSSLCGACAVASQRVSSWSLEFGVIAQSPHSGPLAPRTTLESVQRRLEQSNRTAHQTQLD